MDVRIILPLNPDDVRILLPLNLKFDDLQREYIIAVLEHLKGNRTHTANSLGLSVRGIRNFINIYKWQGYKIPDYDPTVRYNKSSIVNSDKI